MGWRCYWVRKQLALAVGDDLPDHDQAAIEKHLNVCADCQAHRAALQRSREAMLVSRVEFDAGPPSESLWPALQLRLPLTQDTPRRSWLPAGAMAAAGVAIAVLVVDRSGDFAGSLPASPYDLPAQRFPSPTDFTGNTLDTSNRRSSRFDMPADSWDERFPGPTYFHLDGVQPLDDSPPEL
jgi:hypothetical protein